MLSVGGNVAGFTWIGGNKMNTLSNREKAYKAFKRQMMINVIALYLSGFTLCLSFFIMVFWSI